MKKILTYIKRIAVYIVKAVFEKIRRDVTDGKESRK